MMDKCTDGHVFLFLKSTIVMGHGARTILGHKLIINVSDVEQIRRGNVRAIKWDLSNIN